MLSRTYTATMHGLQSIKVEVEVEGNRGTPNLILIGLPTKAVDESKERITASLTSCGVRIRSQRTIVNLAPADVKKSSSVLELAIAVGLLKMYGEIETSTDQTMFFGELSLDGHLKAIRGALPLVLAAKQMGFTSVVLPIANQEEVAVISGITIHPIHHLNEYLQHCQTKKPLPVLQPIHFAPTPETEFAVDFADIIGQEEVKRALEIAAAGGHNILLNGPPGAGKSMMSRGLASILPPMTEDEALEVTKIYSISGLLNQGLIKARPIRSPHHTTSQVGLIGGGNHLQPGEISLAHRGILFLDEFPEFTRNSLEALRQPLEDGQVTISRAAGSATYPARFTLVAAANPCQCGYLGSARKKCSCNKHLLDLYRKKVSGPILDRIDLHVRVKEVEVKKLTSNRSKRECSQVIRHRVYQAHSRQLQRYRETSYTTNAEINSKDVKRFCTLAHEAQTTLTLAAQNMNLSARSYFKVIKVAQTIADLANSPVITQPYIAEALQYRQVDYST